MVPLLLIFGAGFYILLELLASGIAKDVYLSCVRNIHGKSNELLAQKKIIAIFTPFASNYFIQQNLSSLERPIMSILLKCLPAVLPEICTKISRKSY